jgi:hypothetical protein
MIGTLDLKFPWMLELGIWCFRFEKAVTLPRGRSRDGSHHWAWIQKAAEIFVQLDGVEDDASSRLTKMSAASNRRVLTDLAPPILFLHEKRAQIERAILREIHSINVIIEFTHARPIENLIAALERG